MNKGFFITFMTACLLGLNACSGSDAPSERANPAETVTPDVVSATLFLAGSVVQQNSDDTVISVGQTSPVRVRTSLSDDTERTEMNFSLTSSNTQAVVTVADAIQGVAEGESVITVTLASGERYQWTVTVQGAAVNLPPIANAGADQTVQVGSNVTLNGAASSDPEGAALSYSWNTGQTTAVIQQTMSVPGSFVFTLTVEDDAQQRSSDSVTITVLESDSAVPPVAKISPIANTTISQGAQITFDASMSTGAVNATDYDWSFGETGVTASYQFDVPGEVTVTLTVTNADGETSTDSVVITVEAADFASNFSEVHVRGTHNEWMSGDLMTLVADNTWSTVITIASATGEFKFDVSGDWSENYGDGNNDGIADTGTANDNIIIDDSGNYKLELNDVSLAYSVEKQTTVPPVEPPIEPPVEPPVQGKAKNVILMIGDGMGYEQLNATRQMFFSDSHTFEFETFPAIGRMTTHSSNAAITDSAASATAIATGVKTINGYVGVDSHGKPLKTLLEHAKDAGKSTGVVTDVTMLHATPASFVGHFPDRHAQNDIGITVFEGVKDDSGQVIFPPSMPNLLYGAAKPAFEGFNKGWAVSVGYDVATTKAEMDALSAPAEDMFIAGMFDHETEPKGNLPWAYDDANGYPRLNEMSASAIDILENDPDGFFLVIEGGKIDWGGHAENLCSTVHEVRAFAEAVQVVNNWMQGRSDTLLIVTADHETGGLELTGGMTSSSDGNCEQVPGHRFTGPNAGSGNVYHTDARVPVFAKGVGSAPFGNLELDNTDIFTHVMDAWD